MRCPKFSCNSASEMITRFVLITAVAVVWSGMSIPVEGVDNEAVSDLAGMRNCLKAVQEVQTDPENVEKVKAFTTLCDEFLDDLGLDEAQMAVLQKLGYKGGKKSKNEADKDTTKDNEMDKDKIKDPSTSGEQDEDKKKNQEPPKISDAAKDEPSAHMKEDTKEGKGNTKSQALKEKARAFLKAQKNAKQASKLNEKYKVKETKTQSKEKKIPDSKPIEQTEPEQTDKPTTQTEPVKPIIQTEQTNKPITQTEQTNKPITQTEQTNKPITQTEQTDKPITQTEQTDKPITQTEQTDKPITQTEPELTDNKPNEQSEQVQSQNMQQNIPPLDVPKFEIPVMTPQELAEAIANLRATRENLERLQQQPEAYIHTSFPDPNAQGIHGAQFDFGPQFGQQFGQEMPQFQQQEWRPQFQDPAIGAGIPHMGMKPDLGAGIPNPTIQQGVPPFHQQVQFEASFQHQPIDHGKIQVPPAPEWEAALNNLKFGQVIPLPNFDAIASGNVVNDAHQTPNQQQSTQTPNIATTEDGSSTKRKVDEL